MFISRWTEPVTVSRCPSRAIRKLLRRMGYAFMDSAQLFSEDALPTSPVLLLAANRCSPILENLIRAVEERQRRHSTASTSSAPCRVPQTLPLDSSRLVRPPAGAGDYRITRLCFSGVPLVYFAIIQSARENRLLSD